MESQTRLLQFKSGLKLCWISLVVLPLGLLGITGGPCAGPSGVPGAGILLVVGLGCLIAAAYGIVRVTRHWLAMSELMRAFGALSFLGALGASVVGGVYVLIGVIVFAAVIRL